jgi:hypothetical protein
MTQRFDLYAESLAKVAQPDYKPQIIRDNWNVMCQCQMDHNQRLCILSNHGSAELLWVCDKFLSQSQVNIIYHILMFIKIDLFSCDFHIFYWFIWIAHKCGVLIEHFVSIYIYKLYIDGKVVFYIWHLHGWNSNYISMCNVYHEKIFTHKG